MSTPRKPPPEKPKVLTLEEVAVCLQVHRSTIYRLLRQGKLPGFRIGSDWRFNLEEIDRWRLRGGTPPDTRGA
jgi:excisionase family DNA binding protein